MSDPTGASPRSDGGFVIEHSTVDGLVERLVDTAESLSAGFDQWEEQYVSGPSLYGVIFADANYEQYVDPLGANTWPTVSVGKPSSRLSSRNVTSESYPSEPVR